MNFIGTAKFWKGTLLSYSAATGRPTEAAKQGAGIYTGN